MIIFLKKGRKMMRRPLFKSKWYFEIVFVMNMEKGLYISQFSGSVMSDSLWLHGLQDAWLPFPSPTTGACSNSRPLSQWCHPTISSSVLPSSCLQSFPASGSLPMSQFFSSRGQSIGDHKNKVCHCFHCFHFYLPWSDRTRCHHFSFLNVEF